MTTDEKIDQVLKKIDSTENRIECLSSFFTERFEIIERGLFGDEKFKVEGLVSEVKGHSDQLRRIQSFKTFFKGWYAGAIFILSGIFYGLIELLKYIFGGH